MLEQIGVVVIALSCFLLLILFGIVIGTMIAFGGTPPDLPEPVDLDTIPEKDEDEAE